MLSVSAIRFEDRFCNRWDRGRWVGSLQAAVHMVAALAGCRKDLVALASPFLSFLTQMYVDKAPLPL